MGSFDGGWVKITRRAVLGDIGDNPYRLALWSQLLARATRFETTIDWGGKPRRIPPGTVVFGYRWLAEITGIPLSALRRQLNYLRERHSIDIEGNTRGSIITICNWSDFYEESAPSDTPPAHEQHTDEHGDEHAGEHTGETPNGELKNKNKKTKGAKIYFYLTESGAETPTTLLHHKEWEKAWKAGRGEEPRKLHWRIIDLEGRPP